MQKNTRAKIIKWLKIVLVIYVLCGMGLYFLQEKLIFHPEPLPADHKFRFTAPFKEINLAVTDDKNLNIVQFTVPDSVCKGVVLYFHGNMSNIEPYASFASLFTHNHYEVWMPDYPGFGKTTGPRTEQTMYDDAQTVYKMAKGRFSEDSIIIYGRSIGTGVAAQLASRTDSKKLILETPYYSLYSLMQYRAFMYPVSWMAKFHFPVYEYMKKTVAPVIIFHGTNDGVIPYSNAARLKKLLKPADEFITIENGGHNDLAEFPLFQNKLDSLLQ